MIIEPLQGLGDEIYQRAFIKQLDKPCYIKTPWPELYNDIDGVHFLKPSTPLRTQRKNEDRQPDIWSGPPKGHKKKRIVRSSTDNVIEEMKRQFEVEPGTFDLPVLNTSIQTSNYAIIRPVTLRKERQEIARNCKPQYINEIAQYLLDQGYHVISIADVDDENEWIVGNCPPASQYFHRGELNVTDMLGAIQNASVVTGPVGWIVPAAVATTTPTWIVCGGQGMLNSPEKIVPLRHINMSNINFQVPDKFCYCKDRLHNGCDKTISNHLEQFKTWLTRFEDI